MSLFISGATIIDGVADKPLDGQSICIENGRIKAIANPDQFQPSKADKLIDARGKFAIPGLMDANVHLMGDIRMEHLVRYEGRYEELITEAAQLALKCGLTTVFDTWGPRKALAAVRDRINSGQTLGSRIFCAGNIVGLDGPFSADFIAKALEVASGALAQRINSLWVENVGPDLTWMTPEQVADEVRAYIETGVDFIKYASNEHRGGEPNAFLLFSSKAQACIVNEAHRVGVTAQAHTSSVEGLRVAIEAGCDLIQHCNITGPVPIPRATIELLTGRKIGAVVFPFTERRLAIMKEKGDGMMRRYFSTSDANCRNIIDAGAMVLLATDAGIQAADATTDPLLKNNWMASGDDNLAELGQGHFHWLKAMEEKGLPAMQGLRAATTNIAIAYGKDKELGTIESGKVADMLILNKNPLLSAENYRNIHMVIKDGIPVNREELPIDALLTKQVAPVFDADAKYGRYAVSRYPPVSYPSCC